METGARCGSALPGSKMSAGLDARGEAVAPPPPCDGAMLGAAPIRALLAGPVRAGALEPPAAAHTGGVGKGRRESGTGMGRASEALSRA